MNVMPIPSFSRVEIRVRNKGDLLLAATELRSLADELVKIAKQPNGDLTASIVAHHTIRATSKKLRGSDNLQAAKSV